MFYFKKHKQDQPLKFIKEVEMLKETADRRELSTSTEMEGEGPEEKMVRRATGQPTRQDTKTVSRARLDVDLDVDVPCRLKLV